MTKSKAFTKLLKATAAGILATGLLLAPIGSLDGGQVASAQTGQTFHKLTVYYWSPFAKPYAYFKSSTQKWTDFPGRAMKLVKMNCYKIELMVTNQDSIQIAFNDGYDLWDDKNGKYYTIPGRLKTATVTNGVISAKAPDFKKPVKVNPMKTAVKLTLPDPMDDSSFVTEPVVTRKPAETAKPPVKTATPRPTAKPATPKPATPKPVITPEPEEPMVTEEPTPAPTAKPAVTTKPGGSTNPGTIPAGGIYSVNKTFGKKASSAITIDGANNGEWNDANLIATGAANDDPRSLGKNWTMHEVSVDMTHLWAAWDDSNLYLAWQYVDVTDVVDPSNAGSSANEPIRVQKFIQSIAFDTVSGQGSGTDMWGKNGKKPFWTGADLPDYQIYIASNLWQGFISKAVDGKFVVEDKVKTPNYQKIDAAGIEVKVGKGFAGTKLLGALDADDVSDSSKVIDFLTKGHDKTRDSFYEMKIPLAALGNPDIDGQGIGVFLHQGEFSALDSLPKDPATFDTAGVEEWNSPKEWADTDAFTVPFARVGKSK